MGNKAGREKLLKPVSKFIFDWGKGYARLKQSRWFRRYCFSQCYLENDEWNFEDICITEEEDKQNTLFRTTSENVS
jgi:hypothetical protein